MKELTNTEKIEGINILIKNQESFLLSLQDNTNFESDSPFMCHEMKDFIDKENRSSISNKSLYKSFPEFEKFINEGSIELGEQTSMAWDWPYKSDNTEEDLVNFKIKKLKEFKKLFK